MDTSFYAAGAALLTHQLVDEIKKRGWISNGLVILVTSFVINFVLALGWALFEGQALSVTFARALAQTVGAALYHDAFQTPKA